MRESVIRTVVPLSKCGNKLVIGAQCVHANLSKLGGSAAADLADGRDRRRARTRRACGKPCASDLAGGDGRAVCAGVRSRRFVRQRAAAQGRAQGHLAECDGRRHLRAGGLFGPVDRCGCLCDGAAPFGVGEGGPGPCLGWVSRGALACDRVDGGGVPCGAGWRGRRCGLGHPSRPRRLGAGPAGAG